MRKTLFAAFLFLAPLATVAVQPAVAAEAAGAKTVTLAVENMNCAACPITVRKALENVPGVVQAEVDYKTKSATVTFDPAKTKVKDLTQATTKAGYPSKATP